MVSRSLQPSLSLSLSLSLSHFAILLDICFFCLAPPGVVAGLYADPATPTTTTVDIFFFLGADHGEPIDYLIIEYEIQSEKGKWYFSNLTHSKSPYKTVTLFASIFFNVFVSYHHNAIEGKMFRSLSAVYAPSTVIAGNQRDMRTITVRGLDPGNAYSFRIKSVNALGVGPPCQPSCEF